MPVNTHLKLIEITDFAPGLWEASDWLMPASGAQEMTDCYPQPGGGLRAFFKGTAVSVSGIADITKERPIGLHARGGVPLRSGAPGDGIDRYLMTYSFDAAALAGQKARPKLYRMDGSNAEATWTQIFVTSGTTQFSFATDDNNAPQKVNFRFFRLSAGSPNDKYVLLSLLYVAPLGQPGAGLYRLNYNDLSSALKAIIITTAVSGYTNVNGPLVTHQGRVLVASGNDETIVWSDAGTVTFGAANFLPVEPNQDLPNIIAMQSLAPSDLIVMKEGAPWVVVQGDITDPTVQQMNEGIHAGGSGKQDFGRTPEGMAFIATDGSVYLTSGYEFNNISRQLGSFASLSDFVGPGDLNYLNEFIFAPSGYVYDTRTQSWFKQTQIAGGIHNVERYTRTIWGPSSGTSFAVKSLSPFNSTSRLNTFSWKSAPMRSDDGRQLEIREVEVIAKPYDASATIAVTVGGVTVTKTLDGSSTRQDKSFLFKARGEILDVRMVSTAGNAANEAPSIEAVRIYTRSGHMTY